MARLTRITTRSGDRGTTRLADGRKVAKDDPRIEALGAVDELASVLGVLLAEPLPPAIRRRLERVQHHLLDLGAEIALPGRAQLDPGAVARLERWQAALGRGLGPLEEFLLPGGCRPAALAHQARAVCRRAERRVAALERGHGPRPGPEPVRYLNRLSDLLFVLARRLNRIAGVPEPLWSPGGR
ncbi:MAG: cob(I)yrinic acid a,c-diamide adenosyltransferase [Nitrospirae bacterium]|nr:MAG: cob(I)yrinic acid a,c-diamide adenosyltransferase [Nitrospirota bacterium]